MKKNLLIIIIVVAVILLSIIGFLVWRGRKVSPTPPPEEEGVLLETSLEERPYVTLTPRADGREFTLDISRIKNAQKIEYELVYLSNGLSRGVIGSITLKGEEAVSRKLLLGTCSRNVCKYDEGVSEGTLTLRFRNLDGVRKFTADFHLQQGEEELNSIDGNFKVEGDFSSDSFYLTMPTIGLPDEIEGELILGPYGVFTAGSEVVKNGGLTLSLEEVSTSRLYAWTGRTWEEMKGAEIEDKTITAEIDNLATFIIVFSNET